MSHPKQYESLTAALRQAIRDSGMTVLEIEEAIGKKKVKRQSLMKFMAGHSLKLATADELAKYFGLVTVQAGRSTRPAPRRRKGRS